MKKMNVGLIGCGSISQTYLKNAKELYADSFAITAVSDLRMEAAEAKAREFGTRALTTEELLADPDIDLILNLTVPNAHRAVIIRALEAGKHVYTEKPFGVSREDAAAIMDAMRRSGKRLGSAPDTFMGMPFQTALKAIKSGCIGRVMGANCMCIHPTHGNENWHPEPFFFYKPGAGPMFDMGAYYLNMMICAMGPASRVMCMQTMNFKERLISTEPHKGEYIHVEVPTHVASLVEFASGAVVTFMNSLDVWNSKQPWIEIYGTEGTLVLPDPNHFKGEVLIARRYGRSAWEQVPDLVEYQSTQRGAGLADMIEAIADDRPIRPSAEMACHVNEIINGFDISSETGAAYLLQTTCEAPKGRWEAY